MPELHEWAIKALLAMVRNHPEGMSQLRAADNDLLIVDEACKTHWQHKGVLAVGKKLRELFEFHRPVGQIGHATET